MNSLINWMLAKEAGRRIEIQILMDLVTSSLGLPRQNLLTMPSGQSLEVFAALTSKHLAASDDLQRKKLHDRALRLGRRLRRCLLRRDPESLTRLTFLLYRGIGIHMEGGLPGKVTIRSCHFSRHYSPQTCAIAFLMDSGVICGLFGEGQIRFHERLTEGRPCCLLELSVPSKHNNPTLTI